MHAPKINTLIANSFRRKADASAFFIC